MLKFRFLKLARYKGVPIYSHWSLSLALFVILIFGISSPALFLFAFTSWLIMLIHELGHMFVASRLGLNTLKIELYPFHGLCHYEMSENDYENYLVAWGGVAAQALIFIPLIILHQVFGKDLPGILILVVMFLGYFSALIALVNLLPSKGLDGATCWKALPIYFNKRNTRKSKKKGKKFKVIK